jgi:hypothetical protein
LSLQPEASLGEPPSFPEYALKAAFLSNLPAFVSWPHTNQASDTIEMCIVGRDPFGANLDYLVQQASGGISITVSRLEPGEDASGCSVVFLGAMKRASRTGVLRSLAGRAILTVSESDGFTKAGGMVCFVTRGDQVSLEINRIAAEAGGLEISAQLLSISNVVDHPLPLESDR